MRIFVAGPWGDFDLPTLPWKIAENITKADFVGQELVHMGHQVFVPHTMCRTWSGLFAQKEMEALDDSFLEHWAEALFRIPGHSTGAILEENKAFKLGLLVFRADRFHLGEDKANDKEYIPIWDLLKTMPE